MIPLSLWHSTRLSNQALRVYGTILSYAWGKKTTCFPAQETLARNLSVSDKTIRRALEELQELGLLTWQRRPNKSNLYTICSIPDSFFVEAPLENALEVPTIPDRTNLSDPDRTSVSTEIDEEEALDRNPSDFDPASRACAKTGGEPSPAPKTAVGVGLQGKSSTKVVPRFGQFTSPGARQEPAPDKLAGLELSKKSSLTKMFKKWQDTEVPDRTWPMLEIDYLQAWEETFPDISGVRWPSYASTVLTRDGNTTIQVGAVFYALMSNLFSTYGYAKLRTYIQFCVHRWSEIKINLPGAESTPNIVLIVKRHDKLMPYCEQGWIPQVRNTQFTHLGSEDDFLNLLKAEERTHGSADDPQSAGKPGPHR